MVPALIAISCEPNAPAEGKSMNKDARAKILFMSFIPFTCKNIGLNLLILSIGCIKKISSK